MIKRLLVVTVSVFLIFSSNALNAQEKVFTANDAIYMNRDLYPASIPQLKWIKNSENYSYAKDNGIYQVGARNGTETLLFDLDMINKALNANNFDSISRLPRISFTNYNTCLFSDKSSYYEYSWDNESIALINNLPENAENIDFDENARFIAYTIDNNVYINIDGKSVQVTNDTNPEIVNGATVHRVEFGINKGLFWSPEAKKLAFYRKDESMVTDYPLVNINARTAEVENTKYPMAGMTSHQVTLGVYDLENGKTVFMKTGEPTDHYLTSVTWDPSGYYIYIAILNREQNHLKLNKYDVKTGELASTLFEEKNSKYVEPENPLYFLPDDPNYFIWQSERDGWNHMYLYKNTGEMVQQITKGNWVVTELKGVYDGKQCYFSATKESPLENNLYKVKIGSDKIQRITPDHGTHRAQISSSGKYIIDIYSSTDVTREYKLLNSKGKTLRIIQNDSNPLADYNLGEMSIFTLKSDNDDDLYCRLIKPIDFDSTKKYPVIVYVYGGPHAQLITDSWLGGAGFFLNYLSQNGYVVFTLDNRGSANRGRDFEQSIHRQVGENEAKDQLVGVKYLKSLPYVDTAKIGVDGWSYGGFMTINLMLTYPEIFKVGVAGGPVIDWKYYEVMYGERYMDTPEENPEGYEKSSLLNKIENFDGRLLIIHGTSDPTVVWQHSQVFLKSAIEHDKNIDYFVYPGHGHNVRGIDRAHLYKKILTYFNDFLK